MQSKKWLYLNQQLMTATIKKKIVSHNGNEIEAINISKASEIWRHDLNGVDIIGIDEIQFF